MSQEGPTLHHNLSAVDEAFSLHRSEVDFDTLHLR